jgi:hypothetical protein
MKVLVNAYKDRFGKCLQGSVPKTAESLLQTNADPSMSYLFYAA